MLRPEDEEADAALLDRPGDEMALLLLPLVLGPLILDMETAGVWAFNHG